MRRYLGQPHFFFLLGFFLLAYLRIALPAVSRQPSHVSVENHRLIVQKRLPDNTLSDPEPYSIKGVTWSPASKAPRKGPNPLYPLYQTDYGFFHDWPARNPQGHDILAYWKKQAFKNHYLRDLGLMKEMNVNTIRTYTHFGTDPEILNAILDECVAQGIMVIMTVALTKEELEAETYLNVVRAYKHHPAILMWLLGNEWNFEHTKYFTYGSVAEATAATERAAQKIKAIDPFHPVSSCLGDRFDDGEPTSRIEWIVANAPSVDIWGLNVYRGSSFYHLFTRWSSITQKPFYLSEFGTDSFHTTRFTRYNGYLADHCQGYTNESQQAAHNEGLWEEIVQHLSTRNGNEQCVGGCIHEFNDSLWKVGCYHTGLGGLVNYNGPDGHAQTADDDSSYDEYNTEGFIAYGQHPDNVSNEEHFGIVTTSRQPKDVFYTFKRLYAE